MPLLVALCALTIATIASANPFRWTTYTSASSVRNLLVTDAGLWLGTTGGLVSFDRATGEFVWATETIYQNVVSEITPEGRAIANVEIIPTAEGQQVEFCPAIGGGRLWQATSYSPNTGLFYLPAANTCARRPPGVRAATKWRSWASTSRGRCPGASRMLMRTSAVRGMLFCAPGPA